MGITNKDVLKTVLKVPQLEEQLESITQKTLGTMTPQMFGCILDGIGGIDSTILMKGTDNTVALQNAVDYCIANNKKLHIPYTGTGKLMITDTIVCDGKLDFSADQGVLVIGKIYNKTKSVFKITNNDGGTWSNIRVSGAGYLPLSSFQFSRGSHSGTKGDSQKMVMKNCYGNLCRHGIYINEPECLNRVTFDGCEMIANWLWGFYLDSYGTGAYAQQGPITFKDCLFHFNGHCNTYILTTYDGVTIKEPTDIKCGQIYMKGFLNASFYGGQWSSDLGIKLNLLSLATFDSGNGLNINGVDVEGFTNPIYENGTIIPIANYETKLKQTEGSAINVLGVSGVTIQSFHAVANVGRSLIKIAYGCQNVSIVGINNYEEVANTSYKLIYTVEGYDTNTVNKNASNTKIDYVGNLSKINDNAFFALTIKPTPIFSKVQKDSLLLDTVNSENKFGFDYLGVPISGTGYKFGYIGDDLNAPSFTRAIYNTRNVSGMDKIYGTLVANSGSTTDGKFFIQAIDKSGNHLGYSLFEANGKYSYGDYVLREIDYTLPPNTFKVNFGLVNSKNYDGDSKNTNKLIGWNIYAVSGRQGFNNI